jgi:hypothetical protein
VNANIHRSMVKRETGAATMGNVCMKGRNGEA